MADTLPSGTFIITSYFPGNPHLGVPPTLPAFQPVLTDPHTSVFGLKAIIQNVGGDSYNISLGGYAYTGRLGDVVFASIYPEQSTTWKIEWREPHGAYTIASSDDNKGWTIATNDGHFAAGKPVTLKPIVATASFPPYFLGTQLFRFEPYAGED